MTLLISMLLAAASAAHPCHADVERLCKDVQPGEGRIAHCMKEHDAQLSPECKEKIATYREEAHETVEACNADAEKFCKDIKRGGGRVIACLKQHESELSPECKAAGDKLGGGEHHRMHPMNTACNDDIGKFCKDVKPGGGRIIACLRQHESDLAPGCSGTLKK